MVPFLPRKPNFPLLYTIGDSISLGWLPFLAQQVVEEAKRLTAARYTVARAPGAGTSLQLRDELSGWLYGHAPSVVVFNCGLHDLGRTAEREWGRTVDPDAYRQNLVQVTIQLKSLRPAPRLLWLHTTPIDETRMEASGFYDNYKRKAEDIDMYNAVAQWVMEEAAIEVLDLNAAVVQRGAAGLLGLDGVHFVEEGYRYLGELVAWSVIGDYRRVDAAADAGVAERPAGDGAGASVAAAAHMAGAAPSAPSAT